MGYIANKWYLVRISPNSTLKDLHEVYKTDSLTLNNAYTYSGVFGLNSNSIEEVARSFYAYNHSGDEGIGPNSSHMMFHMFNSYGYSLSVTNGSWPVWVQFSNDISQPNGYSENCVQISSVLFRSDGWYCVTGDMFISNSDTFDVVNVYENSEPYDVDENPVVSKWKPVSMNSIDSNSVYWIQIHKPKEYHQLQFERENGYLYNDYLYNSKVETGNLNSNSYSLQRLWYGHDHIYSLTGSNSKTFFNSDLYFLMDSVVFPGGEFYLTKGESVFKHAWKRQGDAEQHPEKRIGIIANSVKMSINMNGYHSKVHANSIVIDEVYKDNYFTIGYHDGENTQPLYVYNFHDDYRFQYQLTTSELLGMSRKATFTYEPHSPNSWQHNLLWCIDSNYKVTITITDHDSNDGSNLWGLGYVHINPRSTMFYSYWSDDVYTNFETFYNNFQTFILGILIEGDATDIDYDPQYLTLLGNCILLYEDSNQIYYYKNTNTPNWHINSDKFTDFYNDLLPGDKSMYNNAINELEKFDSNGENHRSIFDVHAKVVTE